MEDSEARGEGLTTECEREERRDAGHEGRARETALATASRGLQGAR